MSRIFSLAASVLFAFLTLFGGVAEAADPRGLPVSVPVLTDPALEVGRCWLSPPPGWEQNSYRLTVENKGDHALVLEIDGLRLSVMAPVEGGMFARLEAPVRVGEKQYAYSYLPVGGTCYTVLSRNPAGSAPIRVRAVKLEVPGAVGPTIADGRTLMTHTDYRVGGSEEDKIYALSSHRLGSRVQFYRF